MSPDESGRIAESQAHQDIMSATSASIKDMVYMVRNKQVMFDFDLAQVYGYEVRVLNQQVKRNIARFPDDFMFELTNEEVQLMKSQIVTSQSGTFFSGQTGGRRKPPKAFTEQGVYMLGAVLRGSIAERQTVFIMRAFREMKQFVANNADMLDKIRSVELRQLSFEQKTDEKIEQIVRTLTDRAESTQKIFFAGQVFDAYSILSKVIGQAKSTILLVDGYVNLGTLDLLSRKRPDVSVRIYTTNQGCRLTQKEIALFNQQYPPLQVAYTTDFHDRFLILDGTTAYHIGASLKDAGKKCFAISLFEDDQIVQDIMRRL